MSQLGTEICQILRHCHTEKNSVPLVNFNTKLSCNSVIFSQNDIFLQIIYLILFERETDLMSVGSHPSCLRSQSLGQASVPTDIFTARPNSILLIHSLIFVHEVN